MRVANIILEDRVGGPQIRIAQVAQGLQKHGIHTMVVSPNNGGDLASLLKEYQIPHRILPLSRFTFRRGAKHVWTLTSTFASQIRKLSQLFHHEQINIIHANGISQPHGPIAAALSHRRIVWHMNDCSTPLIISRPLSLVARHIAHVIPVSVEAAGRYHFPHHYQPGKLFPLLPAPVDTQRFCPQGPTVSFPPNQRLVVTVGNISPVKGTDVFINAAMQTAHRHADVQYWVVGQRIDTQKQLNHELDDQMADCEIKDRIVFLGRRKDIPDILRTASVYVCSSRTEACPISLLEAMATGTPIVATAVGGVPELIRHNQEGLLVHAEDAHAIATAVTCILNDPSLGIRLGTAARKRALRLFRLEHAIQAHIQAYATALN